MSLYWYNRCIWRSGKCCYCFAKTWHIRSASAEEFIILIASWIGCSCWFFTEKWVPIDITPPYTHTSTHTQMAKIHEYTLSRFRFLHIYRDQPKCFVTFSVKLCIICENSIFLKICDFVTFFQFVYICEDFLAFKCQKKTLFSCFIIAGAFTIDFTRDWLTDVQKYAVSAKNREPAEVSCGSNSSC